MILFEIDKDNWDKFEMIKSYPRLSYVSKIYNTGDYLVFYSQIDDFKHIRIRRHDDEPVHIYKDILFIKNKILGEDVEAIEVYPKMDDFVDNTNSYHIWSSDLISKSLPNLKTIYNTKKLNISFDYDGTLEDDFDLAPNPQKQEIQNLASKYIKDGHNVYIITKRYDSNHENFGKKFEYREPLKLARDLGFSQIYYTNREMKFSKIINLKIDIHFENDEYEVHIINQACKEQKHQCLVVNVEDKNWRKLI